MNPKLRNTRVARNACFTFLVLISSVISWRTLVAVFATAFYNDQYSHILLILPVSLAVLYFERSKVFRDVEYCIPAGAFLLLLVMAFVWVAQCPPFLSQNDVLSLRTAFFVSWLVAAFVFCFGIAALRVATFPLLFLLLMIPIPDFVLERTVSLLQTGSTDITFLMLKAANIPVLRNDFVLSLPGIEIEVARECSGIRSSLILFIVSLVLGHLFLQAGWRQALLSLLVLPLTVAKNGLRIFTLSTLAVYMDPSFLDGNLHRHGGILSFSVALGALILVVWWLHKSEKKAPRMVQNYPSSRRPSGLVKPDA
jgi:exosortase